MGVICLLSKNTVFDRGHFMVVALSSAAFQQMALQNSVASVIEIIAPRERMRVPPVGYGSGKVE